MWRDRYYSFILIFFPSYIFYLKEIYILLTWEFGFVQFLLNQNIFPIVGHLILEKYSDQRYKGDE